MIVNPGEVYTLPFTDTSLLGAGIARLGGLALFCPGAVEGDTAEVRILSVKKRYIEAELVRIVSSSSARCTPDCSVFGRCGGCIFRHISYSEETRLKENAVRGALRRFADAAWEPIYTASPEGYRNKAVFHLDPQYRAGYYAVSTNAYVALPTEGCALLPPLFAQIADRTHQTLEGFRADLPIRALAVRKSTDGHFTAVLYTEKTRADIRLAAKKWTDCMLHGFGNTVSGLYLAEGMPEDPRVRYERLIGEDCLTDEFLDLHLRISPAAFYQVNHDVAEALCRTVAEYADLQAGETALLKRDLETYRAFFGQYADTMENSAFTDLLVVWHIQQIVLPQQIVEEEDVFDPKDPNDVDLSGIVNAKPRE